jgi:hypothetical protein
MAMMFVAGRLLAKVQPKYLIATGAVIVALSMYDLTNVYGDLGFWSFAISRMLLGFGFPLIFVPIMTASRDGIQPDKTDQASALINAARNTGGSIGISLASNVLAHREQCHQSRLVEDVIPSSVQYQDTLQLVSPSAAAGRRLDWPASAGAGVAARLYGRFLGPDAGLACGSSARACPAKGQAGGRRAHGPLTPI